jgi:hypothetical protein
MTPTMRHYLISFFTGLALAALGVLVDQFSLHPDGNIDWRYLAFSLVGGVVLFARDWLRNNSGAILEGVAPAQVQSAVDQKGAAVLVPTPSKPILDTLESPPAH